MPSPDPFGARASLGPGLPDYWRLDALADRIDLDGAPITVKILLENVLRNAGGGLIEPSDVETLAAWRPGTATEAEIPFMPSRVLLQDFTGVPAIVDLAAMRDAMADLGGDPARVNPLVPADLVIDHSVQVDMFGTPGAFAFNVAREYERNGERYQLLRWAQTAFRDLRVVPPGTGIVHQVNLEYLATVVADRPDGRRRQRCRRPYRAARHRRRHGLAHDDGQRPRRPRMGRRRDRGRGRAARPADLHGDAPGRRRPAVRRAAARLDGDRPRPGRDPDAPGVRRRRRVRRVRRRRPGGPLARRPRDDREHEPRVRGHLDALPDRRRDAHLPSAHRALARAARTRRGVREGAGPVASPRPYAGLRRPPDPRPRERRAVRRRATPAPGSRAADAPPRELPVQLSGRAAPPRGRRRGGTEAGRRDASRSHRPSHSPPATRPATRAARPRSMRPRRPSRSSRPGLPRPTYPPVTLEVNGQRATIRTGSVAIAAITSCTNTSNPTVMVGAGLLARNAVARGLRVAPTVKTSLAPGSKAVTTYLANAGLMAPLEQLGFALAGYGCTTCIGNSGPLDEPIAHAIEEHELVTAAVLSGNRNFEGRIHPLARASYLASPPLVVAFALAGRVDIDLTKEPLGIDDDGKPVFLADLWPSSDEIKDVIHDSIDPELFRETYASVFEGDDRWRALPIPEGDRYEWDPSSTYVARPPYFEGLTMEPVPPADIVDARVLALFGDSVTTDHISPAGSIVPWSPAGKWLQEHGVTPLEFNSYGSRRGHHEVLIRGTFGNIRLRNALASEGEGPYTRPPAGWRGRLHLRRRGSVPIGGRAQHRDRRARVRLRLVARLGGEGPAAPRGPRGDRPELRAHPPDEPRRDGDPPAGVPRRREPGRARPDRARGLHDHAASHRSSRGRGSRSPPTRTRAPRRSSR